MHRLLAAFSLAFALLAPAATPRPPLATVLQDDALTLHQPPDLVADTMRGIRALGVTHLRVTAVWRDLEPGRNVWARPRLEELDTAVFQARAAGLQVMIDVGFRAPDWARAGAATTVDPRPFASFAAAIATRYSGGSGGYAGELLPRADVITLWNEPNHPGFLAPQFVRGRPASPDLYRRMVRLAYPAVRRASPGATVLIGATASEGQGDGARSRGVPPLEFIRLLACVDRSLQPLRTPGCRRFTPIPGDGWSHHPWAWRHPPEYRTRSDDARIGDLPRLQRLLDALVARHRLAPGLRDLWITEFGYEPNVPVRTRPWSLAQQARLLPRAERIAWADPHVRSWGQFLLRDVETFPAVLASSFGEPRPVGSWQTGLLFESGAPKPAARSFRLALVVGARGLWGHVRPADGPVQVEVQRRVPGTTWKRVALVRTAPDGTFAYAPAGGSGRAAWRYAWRSATGTETSPATSP